MSDSLKKRIRELALEVGFDDCRIARATEAKHASAFDQWIADGCHGDMTWMERNTDRRKDPRVVLPHAKTVIVLALNYFQGDTVPRKELGQFARYAWHADYHEIIEKKMIHLADELASHGGTQKQYVDYGPVLERDFASEAGLGWNGKSTIQIHPKLGTWFFLSEIITTLELPPDTPMNDHCGKCTACIDACPTQAITHARHLDARKCISYLTIEHKGAIPEEFRIPIGDRIYGCDDCLAVCPWNRFAKTSKDIQFQMPPEIASKPLRDFLSLDEEAFRTLFRKSPIKRIKRPAFLRNVCVALGNVGTDADLPALQRAGKDPDPLINEHAIWAIAQIKNRRAKASR
ncbi:MAG: tRNA epoxyqueuosine(34) reductase QueG [Verrucomicrobiota bacterium]